MKRTLILALALGFAPAFAGQATLVELPNTAPVAATPAVVAPACTGSAFAIEVGPNYTSMIDGIDEEMDIDTVGVDVTGVYNIDSNWAVTLRFSWATGDKTEYDMGESFKWDVTNWSIAPGIRYTVGLTENLSAFAGANVGYGNTDIKLSFEGYSESIDDSGLTYAIEAGLKYDLCESVYLYGAAQYWGTTAQPSSEGEKADKQNGINFRLGVGFSF